MTRHPMDRIRQPTQPEKLIPVVADDELTALLATCSEPAAPPTPAPPTSPDSH